jgi:opacity protein-like surface antigen
MDSKSMIKKAASLFVLLILSTVSVFGQKEPVKNSSEKPKESLKDEIKDEIIKHKTSLTVGASALKFLGYVGSHTDVNPLLDTRIGYYLEAEQRFGKILGIALAGTYGKLAGTDNSLTSHLNFQSTIMQGELALTANFDKVMKNDPSVSPFLSAGVGFMMFNSSTDLKNGNVPYNYWSDGSIRDLPESPGNVVFANVIKRDYTYETKLKSGSCIVIPVGGGINFHIGERWIASVGGYYVLTTSKDIDNNPAGQSNSYIRANVGIQYEFRAKYHSPSENVDFDKVDHVDVDGDGVPDDKDNCLGTPKGVLVDSHGCPFDTDGDGVPDYMDKEPKSKKGAKVDGYGVTINEDELAKHQLEWDKMAVERSEKFNEAPSLEYLKEVENKGKEINKGKGSKIPPDLQSADLNNDGFITAEEITKTIDAFFEGSNDYTVEKINKLIDYFFEQ